jgi:hypothetical protein
VQDRDAVNLAAALGVAVREFARATGRPGTVPSRANAAKLAPSKAARLIDRFEQRARVVELDEINALAIKEMSVELAQVSRGQRPLWEPER